MTIHAQGPREQEHHPADDSAPKRTFTGGLHRASELDSVGAPSVPWAALHPKLPHAPIPSVFLPHVLKSDYRAEVVATGPVFKISPLGLLRITPELQMPRNLSISQADKLQPGRCPSALPSAPAQDTLHLPGSHSPSPWDLHRASGLGTALRPHSPEVRGTPALWPRRRQFCGRLMDSAKGYFRLWVPSTPSSQPLLLLHRGFGLLGRAEHQCREGP